MITVIHGGQTGVDRGAHEAALANGWLVAGYMPNDGRDERGPIPPHVACYLRPHTQQSYAARTEANVRGSNAVLVVARDADNPRATPGTAKTIDLATARRIRPQIVDPTSDVEAIASWLWRDVLLCRPLALPLDPHARDPWPVRLMVAGPRESKWAGAQAETATLLRRVGAALSKLEFTTP